MGTVKRKRSSNWENEEKELLKLIMQPFRNIIDNRDTSTPTNVRKKKAWAEITRQFNKANKKVRDTKQLKSQFGQSKLCKPKRNESESSNPLSPQLETNAAAKIIPEKFKVFAVGIKKESDPELSAEGSPETTPFMEGDPSMNGEGTLDSNSSYAISDSFHILDDCSEFSNTPSHTHTQHTSGTKKIEAEEKKHSKRSNNGDINYFRTQENERLEKEHQLRMLTMIEVHNQTMKNLKLQEQIYEKVLQSYKEREVPSHEPTLVPSPVPTQEPSPVPTQEPSPVPTQEPSPVPTQVHSASFT